MRWAALALAALVLSGCETTQEKSARLERSALRGAASNPIGAKGLRIKRASSTIKVVASTVLHDSEGAAAVVTLRNDSPTAQKLIPLAVTVHGSGGASVYTNLGAGLARSLTSASYLGAHSELSWVDDQVETSATPTSVSAEVGEGRSAGGPAPKVKVHDAQLGEEPGGIAVVKGSISNGSTVEQRELVVYAIASRNGRVLAAGRAVLSTLGAGASSSFQIFLIGSAAKGAKLSVSAPPSSFG